MKNMIGIIMNKEYIQNTNGGIWAISRTVNGQQIDLIQERYLDNESDWKVLMQVLGLEESLVCQYFFRDKQGRLCPTFELVQLFAELDDKGNPQNQIGV